VPETGRVGYWSSANHAGEVLLPGDGARLTPTTFDDWLAAGPP
jgi:hypothetical protein